MFHLGNFLNHEIVRSIFVAKQEEVYFMTSETISRETLSIKQSPIGTINWLLQRISAVLLVIFLGFHLLLLHTMKLNATYDAVTERLKTTLYLIVDLTLLLLVTYHALNGIRMILYDVVFKDTHRKVISIFLVLLGILTWGAGAWILFMAITM